MSDSKPPIKKESGASTADTMDVLELHDNHSAQTITQYPSQKTELSQLTGFRFTEHRDLWCRL